MCVLPLPYVLFIVMVAILDGCHVIRYPKDNAGQTLVEIGPMVSEENILNTVVYHDRC